MSRRSTARLEALEAHYRELLIVALGECARGKWGLFGHNEQVIARMNLRQQARQRQGAVQELLELGQEIEVERDRLGFADPFDLHHRLMLTRSSCDANTIGEPKIARQWLDELSA